MAAFAAAHRGLSSEHPENTLPAFEAAVAAGFPALEMDLRLTRDGHVVILHDATLSRTTDGEGEVADLDLREAQAFATGAGPVPTLEALLDRLRGWGGLLNLEVKAPEALEGTLRLARERIPGRFQVSSMLPGVLLEARDLDAQAPLALIPLGPVEGEDWEMAREAECQWVNVDQSFLDPATVAQAREAGMKVGAWTVNDPERARELSALGVQCVITDRRDVGEAIRPGAPHSPFPSWA